METEKSIGLGITFTILCMTVVGLGLYLKNVTKNVLLGSGLLWGGVVLVFVSVSVFIVPALKSYIEEFRETD